MRIESGRNDSCLTRAFSTMRLVLGIKSPVPVSFDEHKGISFVVKNIGQCFPDNKIYIWCAESLFLDCESNVSYCGDSVNFEFDDTKYIIAFAYQPDSDSDEGHIVLGLPCAYNNSLCLVIAVRI